jgi:hypothetical protein
VRVSIDWNQELKFFASFKFVTQPAAFNFLLLSEYSNFAEGRTATVSASFSATKLHNCTKNLVALLIFFEVLAKRKSGNEPSKVVVSCALNSFHRSLARSGIFPENPWQSPQ